MIGLGLRLRALGRPGHWGTCSFPKKEKHPWAVGHSGTRANARFQKTALGTRALGHLLFSKKKKNTLGQLGTRANARFQKTVMGTRALGHSGTHQKTIKRLSKRLSIRLSRAVAIYLSFYLSIKSSDYQE